MSDITAIGLGNMGAALTHGLVKGSHRVTVWNRTPAKMEPLIDAGASAASSLADAIAASPVIQVCIDDYAATRELLSGDGVAPLLRDRTIVQLSTGTPKDADEAAKWMHAHGVHYLDGAIIGGPENLHTHTAEVIFAGPGSVYAKVQPLLTSLCPQVRHVGENIRAAATLDLAWLCHQFGVIIGGVQGAYLCHSEGVDMGELCRTYRKSDADWAPYLVDTVRRAAYTDTGATLRIWDSVLQLSRKQASEAGTRNEFMDFMAGLFERALTAGYGDEDAAALFKILKADGGPTRRTSTQS